MSQRVRFGVWIGGAAVWLGLFLAWIISGFGGDRATLVFDDVGTVISAVVAAGACLWAATRRPRGARRGWAWLAACVGSLTLSEAIWGYYEVVAGRAVPFPSVADVAYLASVPFGIVALLSFRSAPSRAESKVRALLDGLLIAGGLLFVSWAFVLGPIYRSSSGSMLEQVLTIAYPVTDVLLASIALEALARSGRGGRGPLVLVALGLLVMAVADSVYAYLTQIDAFDTANSIDAIWIAGYLLFALAAVSAVTATEPPLRDESRIGLIRIGLPYVPLVAAGATAVSVQVLHGDLGSFLFWAGFVIITLVVGRQLVSLLENRTLNAGLEASVASLHEQQALLRHLAFHDPLTQLANRTLFRDRIEHAIARSSRHPHRLAVIFLDLDDFKTVNDSLGHANGDELLAALADRLRGCVRQGDTVARLGGDEFGILIEDDAEPAQEATRIAERVLDSVHRTFLLGGHELQLTASIGISVAGSDVTDADTMLRHADLALYQAKAQGKNRHRLFEISMGSVAIKRLELKADLQRAIEEHEFALAYQPIVRLDARKIIGFEALLRWHHPSRGILAPDAFLSLAEETGLIIPIGRWVLTQAGIQARFWQQRFPGFDPMLKVHVNLSVRQLQEDTLVGDIVRMLATTGVDPKALVFEVTESSMIHEPDAALEQLTAVRTLGIELALDDFGTGYSSLSYLHRFPFNSIKIDQSFVRHIDDEIKPAALVSAVVQLARALDLTTVAEGVETRTQAAQLRAVGCDAAQGYYFGRPATPEHATALITAVIRHREPAGDPHFVVRPL